jgi:hypothetical protein
VRAQVIGIDPVPAKFGNKPWDVMAKLLKDFSEPIILLLAAEQLVVELVKIECQPK